METYERGTCFIETKEKDILTFKGVVSINIDKNEVFINKKNGITVSMSRNTLVSIWFRQETCYDFSEEGGEA